LVGKQTVSWPGEAQALHLNHLGEPFVASRVCDERFGKNRRTALDSAPGSQSGLVSLDSADAFIDDFSSILSLHPLFLLGPSTDRPHHACAMPQQTNRL